MSASDTTLTIHTQGAPICVDISGANVEQLEAFAGGRFVGYALYGYEWDTYEIADRKNPSEPVSTGERPTFSPSGHRFAAVQTSGAGWGGLEGLGAWEVTDKGIKELLFVSGGLLRASQAQIDRWVGDDCFVASWRDEETTENDGNKVKNVYRFRDLGSGLRVEQDDGQCKDHSNQADVVVGALGMNRLEHGNRAEAR